MGLFKKRTDPAEVERLKQEITAMAARLKAADAAKKELGGRVDQIVTRLDTPLTPPPTEPPPAPGGQVDPGELDELRAHLTGLAARIDELDARIGAVSTELANQISELSGDIEALGPAAPPTEGVVDELRDAQTRLANEQARYQIAFRQDLADLVEQLRRR